MKTTIHLTHATEIWSLEGHPGPTGRIAEVLTGEVRDYGNNLLFAGPADDCVVEQKRWRIPTRLIPTKFREIEGEVSSADFTWQLVVENDHG